MATITVTATENTAPAGAVCIRIQRRKGGTLTGYITVTTPYPGADLRERVLNEVYRTMVQKTASAQLPETGSILPATIETETDRDKVLALFVESSSVYFNQEELMTALKASNTWGSIDTAKQARFTKLFPTLAARTNTGFLPCPPNFPADVLASIDPRDDGTDWVDFVKSQIAKHQAALAEFQ